MNIPQRIRLLFQKCLSLQYRFTLDGKAFSPAIQSKIKKIIESRDIYLYDEKIAMDLSNNWQGVMSAPTYLRFIENAIPVVLAANEDFAPYTAVMLQSLLDNSNTQRKYHFIIFERKFSVRTKNHLINQVKNFSHCEIDFINVENAFSEIPIVPAVDSYISLDTFLRLFIPYWLDKYPKVIYCDSDMIAKADIAELYDLNIFDHYIGVAVNTEISEKIENRKYSSLLNNTVFLYLDNWLKYINAGVLIFNTKIFNSKFSYNETFKLAIWYTNRYKKRLDDQDILAILVKDNYFILPTEWNHFCRLTKNKYNYLPIESGPKLLHFYSYVKPWKDIIDANDPIVLEYRNYAESVPLFREMGIKY